MSRRLTPKQQHLVVGLGVAGALALLTLRLLSVDSALGSSLIRYSYDAAFLLSPPSPVPAEDPPVMIVYLDLESFLRENQNPAEPWDRGLHAQLVGRLTAAGARAIVFDVVFDQPGRRPDADRQFAEAIRASGRVILGGELNPSGAEPGGVEGLKTTTLVRPAEFLRAAAAGWGVVNLGVDPDFVVRRHLPRLLGDQIPSLTWACARFLGLEPGLTGQFAEAPGWVRYYGKPHALPHVSYSSALDPAGVPQRAFQDRIVFVGARPMTGTFQERRDESRSPYHTWAAGDLFHPGVEVHATQMLNLLRGDWLRRAPRRMETGALLLGAVAFALLLGRFRPVPATGVALLCEAVLVGGVVWWVDRRDLWFPWLIVGAVQIPAALAASFLQHSVDWYRQRRRLEALRRQAERKIREQAELIDKAQDAILVADLDGTLRYANASATRLYGWANLDLPTIPLADTLFPASPAQWEEARHRVRLTGEWLGELHPHSPALQSLVVESRWTLIRDDQGDPRSILMINTDITEKKRLEAQFHRAQRLETIGSLAGGMAHDLNNALSPILMGLQLLRRQPQDDDTRRMLAVMEANTHRGTDMVRQVLHFARGHRGAHQTVQLGPLIREMERMLHETFPRSITTQTMLPDDLWPVQGQPTQLHQVLLNLCVNARDAMPEGGELTLAADNVALTEAEAAEIPGGRPGSFVMLLVSDTGTGIPPELLPRIFEPFFSTKPAGKGTGLGLSTTAGIVRNHGGFLRVQSQVGEGTTFEVYLPRSEAPAPQPPALAPIELPHGQGELLLVAQEEQSLREVMATALREQGYQVLTAASEADAHRLLREHTAALRLILLDAFMPASPGQGLLSEIHLLRPGIPVILIGGADVGRANTEQPEPRPAALLTKPFSVDDLLRLVHRQLAPPPRS